MGESDYSNREVTQAGRAFPATRWSVVMEAKGADSAASRRALSELCEMYWHPLYAYVRHRGYPAADAEDLTQGFFGHLLENNRVELLAETKGRLRSYLLGAMKHFLSDDRDRKTAQKRGGLQRLIPIEAGEAEERYGVVARDDQTPETLYELSWARRLIDGAFERLRGEYRESGREKVFDALEGHIAAGVSRRPREGVAEALGMSEGNLRVALHRLRKRFGAILTEEIAETVVSADEVEDERRHLYAVFG